MNGVYNVYESFGNEVSSLARQLSLMVDAFSGIGHENFRFEIEAVSIANQVSHTGTISQSRQRDMRQNSENIPPKNCENILQTKEIPMDVLALKETNLSDFEMSAKQGAGYACPTFSIVRHRARIR